MFAKRNRWRELGLAQSQGHVISALEVFVNQRPQTNVGQQIAAISNERLSTELGFDIFDAAASFQQNGFMDEIDRDLAVAIFRKRLRKLFRQPVSVDENLFNADVDQMVEGKSDQGLLENGNERFRQFLSLGA